MKRRIDYFSKYSLFFVFFLIVIFYSLFQARFLILGPRLKISFPTDGTSVEKPLIIAEGRARNAAWITLNGRQIFTDEDGFWKEKLILPGGPSIMTIKARDRFGRETEEEVRVFLN